GRTRKNSFHRNINLVREHIGADGKHAGVCVFRRDLDCHRARSRCPVIQSFHTVELIGCYNHVVKTIERIAAGSHILNGRHRHLSVMCFTRICYVYINLHVLIPCIWLFVELILRKHFIRRVESHIRNCHLPIVAADLRSDRVRVVSSSFVGRAAVLVTAFCDSFLSGRLCGNVVAESFIERRSNNKEEHEYADNRTNDRNDQRGNRKPLCPLEEKGDNGQEKRDRKKNPNGNQ